MKTRRFLCKIFLVGNIIWLVTSGCDIHKPFEQYNEIHRPQYHFSPPNKWMGPPSAMVYFSGEYHLFYQKREEFTQGNISWGHAVSKDLVRWEHLPIAIPESENPIAGSGSVIVDWENTSGFGSSDKPVLVALYTVSIEEREGEMEQHLAYSSDRGRTWTHLEENPVMPSNGTELMHPKVFWHNSSSKWIMAAVYKGEQRIGFYTSSDLKKWEFLSDFEPEASTGGGWNSPEIFKVAVNGNNEDIRWVLSLNSEPDNESGQFNMVFFIGEFDGNEFTEDSSAILEGGTDFYAPLTFSNIPDSDSRQIWMGWMNNWKYAEKIPVEPWKGAMSTPREVKLKTINERIALVQMPVIELRELRTNRHRFRNRKLTEESNFLRETGISGTSTAMTAEFEIGDMEEMGFELRRGGNERTVVGYDSEKEELFVDRSQSGETGFDDMFPAKETAPMEAINGRIKLRIFLDRSSVEVFGNEGETVMTSQIFPSQNSVGMALYVRGGEGRLLSLDVWQLQSIW